MDTQVLRHSDGWGSDRSGGFTFVGSQRVTKDKLDSAWGVVDLMLDTDFPDIRNATIIHSMSGSCFVIPRENDKVRLYVQLLDQGVVDRTGRVDNSHMSPERILEVGINSEEFILINEMMIIKIAKKIFHPFCIRPLTDVEWWTIYISTSHEVHSSVVQHVPYAVGQRVASTYSVGDRVFIAGDACHTHSPKAGSCYTQGALSDHSPTPRAGNEREHERYAQSGWVYLFLFNRLCPL